MRQLLNMVQETPAYHAAVVVLSYVKPDMAAGIANSQFLINPSSPAYTKLSQQLSPEAQQLLCNKASGRMGR